MDPVLRSSNQNYGVTLGQFRNTYGSVVNPESSLKITMPAARARQ